MRVRRRKDKGLNWDTECLHLFISFLLVLRQVKNDLLQALKDCQDPACQDIEKKYKIGELSDNGIDYDLVSPLFDSSCCSFVTAFGD